MDKNFISEKIIYYRKLKGLTQEELAEKTELSTRTIQRIESGEVDPRLYTLKSIADVLEVSMEIFNPPPSGDEKIQLALVHFSALSGLLFPLGNILVPLIYWLYKKNNINQLNQQGRALLNAQISYTSYAFLTAILFLVMVIEGGFSFTAHNKIEILDIFYMDNLLLALPLIFILTVLIFACLVPLINGIRIYNGRNMLKYPLTINFIR
ncbi:MAG: helix-turn-helix domain-containing protein [Bacteroidia bacterium]|nr:helix-turn-helix domain-containing protein [Bacteroidia bacterium]